MCYVFFKTSQRPHGKREILIKICFIMTWISFLWLTDVKSSIFDTFLNVSVSPTYTCVLVNWDWGETKGFINTDILLLAVAHQWKCFCLVYRKISSAFVTCWISSWEFCSLCLLCLCKSTRMLVVSQFSSLLPSIFGQQRREEVFRCFEWAKKNDKALHFGCK